MEGLCVFNLSFAYAQKVSPRWIEPKESGRMRHELSAQSDSRRPRSTLLRLESALPVPPRSTSTF